MPATQSEKNESYIHNSSVLGVKFPNEMSYSNQFANSDFLSSEEISKKYFIISHADQNQSSAQLIYQLEYENDNSVQVIGGFEIRSSFHEEINQKAQYFLNSLDNYVKRIQDLKEIALDDGIFPQP